MSYATTQDLLDRYGEPDLRRVTDPSAQAVDVTAAQRALDDAHAEIDSWLCRRYALPLMDAAGDLMSVPRALIRCACDIAVYRLQTLRPADDIKDARQRYEDVLKLLKTMATGDVAIPGAALRSDVADVPAGASVGSPEFGSPPSLWGRQNR
jgi:phage gp36-like protein